MLKILHKGLQISLPMDQTGFTGDIATDAALTVVTKMKAGRLVAQTATTGLLTLADGASATLQPIGFLINDAAGAFMENKPAFRSALLGVSVGPQVVITDQIKTSLTFAIGDTIWAGTGGDVGLCVNAKPLNDLTAALDGNAAPAGVTVTLGSRPVGIALSAASSSSPNLKILAFTVGR